MVRQLTALLASLVFSCSAFAATEYHGFQVEDGGALSRPAAESVFAQLNIVESVGLPAPVLAMLRQTRIVVDPELRGQPGVFMVRAGEGEVRIRPVVFPANKPILLHELLHAYHFKVLTMQNREVIGAFRHAKNDGLFPEQYQSSHFLENPKEYFAVTGTLFLFGDIQQPPFRCAELAKLGEDYLAFLAAQFGPHACGTTGAGQH